MAGDVSGLGNDGTLTGGALFEANTADGSAFAVRFDGVNDFIDLGVVDASGTGLTLAVWFNADSFPGSSNDPRLISKASSPAGNDHLFMLSTIRVGAAIRLRGRVRVGGSTTTLIASSGDLVSGVWRHGALTYDGAALRLYLDGVEVGSTPLSGAVDVDPSVPVAVGAQPAGAGSRFFDGLLDDVRILQRALSVGEVSTIAGGNQLPVAVADGYGTPEDTALVVAAANGVLANDTDPDLDPLQAVLVSDVSNGVLSLNPDGSFSYTPAADFSGTDSFTYAANDGTINSIPATVTLTVDAMNDAPVAGDDFYQTLPDTTLTVNAVTGVLSNDTDPDLDPLQVVLVGDVANGVLSLNGDGSFDYTANGGFSGQDSFTYRASDTLLESNLATVTISVTAPPTAVADGYAVDEDVTLVVSAATGVLANDLDNDPPADLTASVLTNPANGTLTSFAADGGFTYQPDPDFDGVDSFTYEAVDGGSGATGQATVTLTVNPVNDLPVAADDTYQTLPDTALTVAAASGVLANDTDPDLDPLQAVLVSGTSNGALTLNGDGSFDYTPNGGFNGQDSFTYQANDGLGNSNPATVTVSVSGPTDPDALVVLPLDEGGGLAAGDVSGLGNDGTLTGGALFEANTADGSAFAVRFDGVNDFIDLGVVDASGTGLTLAVWFNADSFPGSSNDPRLISKASSPAGNDHLFMLSTIRVGAAIRLRGRVRVGGSTTTLIASSGDLVSGVWRHGALTYDGAALRLYLDGVEVGSTPLSGAVDVDPTIPVAVGALPAGAGTRFFDGLLDDVRILQRALSVGEVSTIAGGNQLPVAVADGYGTPEDTALVVAAANGVLANDTDPDLDPLQAVLVSDVSNGVLSLNPDGSFSYTPAADFSGTDSFTYAANDGTINSIPATVTLTVDAMNDAPVAGDDFYQTLPDTTLTVNAVTGVLSNDTDPDLDPLQVVLVGDVANGVLSLNGDGSFDYTANGGFSGQDSFTYRASDTLLESNLAMVTIAVTAPPTAVADGYAVDEDVTLVVSAATGVLANDLDNDPPADLTASVLTNPANGTLTSFAADGGFTYQPDPDFDGVDSFTYEAVDGGSGATGQATVTLTVNAVNDLPVAGDDTYQTLPDTALTVAAASGVLANDTDPDLDPLQAVLLGGVSNGALTLNGDGSFDYTPNGGFNGQDSFSYQANDGLGNSNPATVTVSVSGPTDPDALVVLPLDEGGGLAAGDVSGLGNDGTLLGGALFEANTADGSAFAVRFDGVNDFIDLGVVDASGTGLTLAVWFNADSFPGPSNDPRLISKASSPAGNDHLFMLSTIRVGAAIRLRGRVRVGGSTTTLIASSGDLVSGVWRHGALTYDGAALRLYLDGVEVGSTPLSGAVDVDPTIPVAVGALPAGAGTRFFDGLLDDVRILQRALSVGEVSTIAGGNQLPVAVADGYGTPEDTALVVAAANGVLANDTDPDLDPLQAVLVSDVSNGVLSLNPDGSFSYTPAADFNGTDSFTYAANDGTIDSTPATVTLTVNAINDAPVAADDGYQTSPGMALTVSAAGGVLSNDTDPDLDPLEAVLASGPSNGLLILNADGSFDYTPNGGFIGQDSFTYQASDMLLISPNATVTIAVAEPPTAVVDGYAVDEDVTLVVSAATGVLANDLDNDPPDDLTASLLTNPANGTLTSFAADGGFTYQPDPDFNGLDSFTYEAVDGGSGVTGQATVTLTVNAVNDLPVAGDDTYQTLPDTALTVAAASGVLANDTDPDLDPLQAVLLGGVSNGALTLNPDGSFDYTPAGGFNGQDSFSYQANDGLGNSNPATVTLNVTNGPQVALWYDNPQEFGSLGRPQQWVNILGNATDPEGVTSLAYRLNGGPELPLSLGHDLRRLVGVGDFNVEIDADDLQPGTNLVSLRAVDDTGAESTTTVNVEYNPGTVWPLPYSIDWSGVTDLTSAVQVVDGHWQLGQDGVRTTEPGYDRLLNFGDRTWQNYEVTAEITVHDVPTLPLSDVGGQAAIGLILRWTGHNENSPHTAGDQPRAGFAPLGSVLWYRYLNPPELQIINSNGLGAVATDLSGYTLQEGVTYNFRARVETIASGHDYTLTVWERGQPEASGVTFNATLALSGPPAGSILLVAHKIDATFGNISVNPVSTGSNSDPVAVDDASGTNEDIVLTIAASDVLANDSDRNGDALSVANVDSSSTLGVVSLGVDGSLTYDPRGAFGSLAQGQTTTDSFEYTVSDGRGGKDTALVTITVTGVIGSGTGNSAPVAENDGYQTEPNTTLTVLRVNGVLANDTDPDFDTLQAILVGGASNGLLTLNADGSFDYTPNGGSIGQDSFTYQASDSLLDSSIATVTILVDTAPVVNGPPRIVSGSMFFGKQVIDATVDETHAVVAAELTGDDEIDAVATDFVDGSLLLYENDGNGGFLSWVLDADLAGAYPASLGDVDSDGDIDVLAGGYVGDVFAWYENLGTGVFSRHDIDTASDGPHSIVTADLDGDGDVDLVTSSQDANTIAWYENDGANSFTAHVIDGTANGAKRAEVADLDGDGDLDVVSASFFIDEIAWYENDGFQNFTRRIIDSTADGAYYVSPADVDGDGDMDLFAASQLDSTIAWYRNDGAAGFVANTMDSSAAGARTVIASDIDGDGDVDALAASVDDDTIAWFRNDGSGGFTKQGIDVAALGAYGVFAIDMDRDGDVDILSASRDANAVALHSQVQGHTASVDLGGTLVIDSGLLLSTDPDDGPAELTYGITDPPAFGELLVGGTVVPSGGSFTQADVDSGLLTYQHDGVDNSPDGFSFTVADGGENGVLPAAGSFAITVGSEGPLVLLPLDEGSGTLAIDASGSLNDGTLVGGPTYEANTADGSAFAVRLDGVDDFIDLGVVDVDGTGLTLAAWFNADSFPGTARDPRLISKATGASANDHVFMLGTVRVGTSVRLRARVRIAGSTTTLIASGGDLAPGVWRHAALTHDGAMLRLYLDGLEVGSAALSGAVDIDSAALVAVGAQPLGAGGRHFDGLIDDVRILQRAMNAVEVSQIAN